MVRVSRLCIQLIDNIVLAKNYIYQRSKHLLQLNRGLWGRYIKQKLFYVEQVCLREYLSFHAIHCILI